MAANQKNKGTPKVAKVKFDPNYFTWPHPLAMFMITFGIYTLVAATVAPHSIPEFLGPLRTFAVYMGTSHQNKCILLCALTLIIHTLEAAYAGKVCHDRGMTVSATIKWVFSTFLFGFTSLTWRLLPYKPDHKIL